MVVLIPSRTEHEGFDGNLMKVEIPDFCECGAKRGVHLWSGLSYDGSRRLNVDCWRNECDHTDTYKSIRDGIATGINKQVPWTTKTTLELQGEKLPDIL